MILESRKILFLAFIFFIIFIWLGLSIGDSLHLNNELALLNIQSAQRATYDGIMGEVIKENSTLSVEQVSIIQTNQPRQSVFLWQDGSSSIQELTPNPLFDVTPQSFPESTVFQIQPELANLFEVDNQIRRSLRSNIAYLFPPLMRLDETATVVLLINPSASRDELSAALLEEMGNQTGTPQPSINVENIEITDRIKAVLLSYKPDSFIISELHDNADQPISSIDTTEWRWSVTANEVGFQSLQLYIFRLIKLEGNEYWREVENISGLVIVEVTPWQRFIAFDWKWLIGIIISVVLAPLFLRWYDIRKKAKQAKTSSDRKYHSE